MEKFWARRAFRVCLQVVWHRVPPTQGWSKGTRRSLAHGVMWSWGRGAAASPAELQTPHTGSGFMFWAGGQDRFSPANCRGRGRSSRLTTDRRPPQEGGMRLLAHSKKKKPGGEMDWSGLHVWGHNRNVRLQSWFYDILVQNGDLWVYAFCTYCWISTGRVHPSLFKMKPVLCLNGMFVFVVIDPAKKEEYQWSL